MIAYSNMPCKLYSVGQYYIVANNTIVSKMRISHQQTIIANNSFVFVFGAAVDGNTFADGCVIANFYCSFFSFKFQVLWYCSDNCPRKNSASITNTTAFHNNSVRHYVRIIAYSYIGFYYSKWIYSYIISYLCRRTNMCKRADHSYCLGRFTICATRMASVTNLSPT